MSSKDIEENEVLTTQLTNMSRIDKEFLQLLYFDDQDDDEEYKEATPFPAHEIYTLRVVLGLQYLIDRTNETQ